jgi:DNA-binding transcriptional regulator YdaS (Cro superfamily)
MGMTLDQYLSENRIKQDAFATRLGISQPTVSRLVGGKQLPSPGLVKRIYWMTEGAVTPNDLFMLPRKVAAE